MNIEYVPESCKGESPIFSGSVVLRAPTFDERYSYLEDSGFIMDEEGEVKKSMLKGLSAVRKVVAMSVKHYLKVDMKRISDGYEFKSFEDLSTDDDGHKVLIDVGLKILNGFKAGKN